MILDFSSVDKASNLSDLIEKQIKTEGELFWRDTELFIADWLSIKSQFEIKTSGTTGVPRTLVFSRESLRRSAEITNQTFGLDQSTHYLMCLPVHFVAGKMMLVRAFESQARVTIVEPSSNPIKSLDHAIDFAAFTPHQLYEIVDQNPEKLNLIKTAIIGGSEIPVDLREKIKHFSTRFFESFGMSETLTHLAIRPLNGSDQSSYFTVLEGFDISTTSEGCLRVKADHLGDKTWETNDVIEQVGPHRFRWLGRLDHVINSGGIKLYPERIEQKIQLLFKRPFAIVKQTDTKLGEIPVLFIESSPFSSNVEKQLLKEIYNRLLKYERPKKIVYLSTFPRNKNGKLIRHKLTAAP